MWQLILKNLRLGGWLFFSLWLVTLGFMQGVVQATSPSPASPVGSFAQPPVTSGITRITTSAANRRSSQPSISADGTKIVFASDADLLQQGIPDNQFEIWLYNTNTLTYTRLTTSPIGSYSNSSPSLSADGTRITFIGSAALLGQGTASHAAVWLYDLGTNTYTRLAVVTDSLPPEHRRYVVSPNLNANGTRITFFSDSDFLGQGIYEGQFEVWLYDTAVMTLTRVTTSNDFYRTSNYPNLTADGAQIYFASNVDFLGQGIAQNQTELWAYNIATRGLTRLTNGSANIHSAAVVPNADGSRLAFQSNRDFLGQGLNHFEVWVYDRNTQIYTRVTVSDFPRNYWSYFVSFSPNGNKVGFISDSDFWGANGTQDQYYIWLYDLTTHAYTRLPLVGTQVYTEPPSFSADGSRVVFTDNVDVWLYQPTKTYLPYVTK